MNELAGTRPPIINTTPSNGTPAEPPPANAAAPSPPPAAKAKRARITPEQIAEVRRLKAEGKTFKEVSTLTGVSIGSIQKYVADGAPKAAKKPVAKAKAKPAAKPAAPAAPKAAPATPAPKKLDALKARLFDILSDGYSADDIRAVL